MPDTEIKTTEDRNAPTSDVLLLFAVVLFGLCVRGGSPSGLLALVGTILLVVAAVFMKHDAQVLTDARSMETRLALGVVLFGALGALGWSRSSIGGTTAVLEVLPGVAWIILGLFIHLARPKHVRFAKTAIAGITLTLTAFLGVVHIVATHGMSFDVLFLHREAAHALTQGLNPYTDAVSVPNGAPTAAPDEMITGYVYPPIPLLFYSIGEWVFSDARYVSLLAFLMFLGVIAIQAVRRPGKGGVLTLLLMASIPGWPLVLRAAWIEPLTLALAAAAFAFWARPVLSSVFLGMTLASKQYFAVTSPLLAVFRGRYWVRRALWAVLLVALTLGSALILNAGAFWESAVAFHMGTGSRADSVNLVGLLASFGIDWGPPFLVPLATGLVGASWAGYRTSRKSQFFMTLALALAASFMVSAQAFANYWFVIAGILGLVLLETTAPETEANEPESLQSADYVS